MRIGVFVILALSLSSSAFSGNELGKKEESLRKFEKDLKEKREKLKRLTGREGSLLAELNRMSESIDRLKESKEKIEQERDELEGRVGGASREIDRLSSEIPKKEDEVSQRLRELYIRGRPSFLRTLLASTDPTDLRRHAYFVQKWVEQDRSVIEQYTSSITSLARNKAALEKDLAQREELRKALGQQAENLETERKGQGDLLALVRTQRNFYERGVRELEAAAVDLQKLIETLRTRETEAESLFAKMRGKLPSPVAGRVEKTFGSYTDPTLKTRLHHKGIDVRAKEGAAIRAVFDGKVAYAGWFTGYGKILILDHEGGFFTLYAHVSKLLKKVGDSVSAGERVGEVGDSGSLKGAYLYFELRQKGISQDPMPWFAPGSFATR